MTTISLFKTTTHIDLGHVYEHIYAAALHDFLFNKGLYAYLDFDIDARTYYKGIIFVDIYLYTPAAERYEDAVGAFEPDIDTKALNIATMQVMAEKTSAIKLQDATIRDIILRELQAQPWATYDMLESIDTRTIKKRTDGLILEHHDPRRFAKLVMTITNQDADNLRAELMPLYYFVSLLLRKNLDEPVANATHCYSKGDTFRAKGNSVSCRNIFTIGKKHATDLSTQVTVTEEVLASVRNNGFVEKIVAFLRDTRMSRQFGAPNYDGQIDGPGIILGREGWKKIATTENVREALRSLTIRYTLGHMAESIRVADTT